MFSVFRMGPATSGRGLCDIDRVLFRVTKSRVEKGPPHFSTRDLATLNSKLSISHSPRTLAAGPIRIAENTESLLDIKLISRTQLRQVTMHHQLLEGNGSLQCIERYV